MSRRRAGDRQRGPRAKMEKAELRLVRGHLEEPGEWGACPFQRAGCRSPERLRNSSQAAQQDRHRSKAETQVFLPERLFCSLPASFSLPEGVLEMLHLKRSGMLHGPFP